MKPSPEQILREHFTPRAPMTAPGRVILVDLGEDRKSDRYVTWWQNGETGGCVWGHYFDRKTEAVIDFEARAARGY